MFFFVQLACVLRGAIRVRVASAAIEIVAPAGVKRTRIASPLARFATRAVVRSLRAGAPLTPSGYLLAVVMACLAVVVLTFLNVAPAYADEANADADSLWSRSTLFGTMGGLRPWLDTHGITLSLQESSEYLANLSGGSRRGGAYDGVTQLGVRVDTEKAIGLPGGTIDVSALQIHGTSLSARNLHTLQNASGLEADASTRLWEVWYQQALPGGRTDIRIGQQSLDKEFMTSDTAGLFMNSTFGWTALPSLDLPAGGPAYPLASPGVRVRSALTDKVTVLAGVFGGDPSGGDPSGGGMGDPQKLNAHGTNFSLHGGALFIGEIQYAVNAPASNGEADAQPSGLPGTYKLGVWYATQRFADPSMASNGVPLASLASNGVAQTHRGNASVYAVADQTVWRAGGDSARSVSVFATAMGAPGDRNLVDFGATAGIAMKAPFAGRDNDAAGVAVGYAQIGSHAREQANDLAFYSTPGYPSRSAETVIEAMYLMQIAPWWQVQGTAQYFVRPAGGVPDPDQPVQRLRNAFVIGAKTTVAF